MLDQLKNYLNITWDDESNDKKLEDILSRAENILCKYAGATSIDFEVELDIKQLLFDCCRYIYNDAYEDFKANFKDDLFMLRAVFAVRDDENA